MLDKQSLQLTTRGAYVLFSKKIKNPNDKSRLSELARFELYNLDDDTFCDIVDDGFAYVNIVFPTPLLDNLLIDNLKNELSIAVKFMCAYIMEEGPDNITVDIEYAGNEYSSNYDAKPQFCSVKALETKSSIKLIETKMFHPIITDYKSKLTFKFNVFTMKAKGTQRKVLAYLFDVVYRVYEKEGKKLNWKEFYYKKRNGIFIKASRLEQEPVVRFIKQELMKGKSPLINDKYVLINRNMGELKKKVELLLSNYLNENVDRVEECVVCGKKFYKTKSKQITCGSKACTMRRMRTKKSLLDKYFYYDDGWKMDGRRVSKDELISELLKKKAYKRLHNPEKLLRVVMDEIEMEAEKGNNKAGK